MAENQIISSDRIRTAEVEADWSTLLARAMDDVSRILQSEIRLLTTSLRALMVEQIDRVLAFAATGALLAGGAVCLLVALILFFHEYLLLPWWQSFGITSLALFAVAIAFGAFAISRPKLPPST